MSFIDEDLTFFSQKPLAHFQPNFECKLVGTNQDGCHAHTLKIFFPGITGPILIKLCMKHQRPKLFIICENYDPGLPMTYFMARSNFAT